ncbi:hypothetical protein HMPREF1319_0219 [Capnocytophaga ochracea str. Holt 25]|nr:hypothetical protein HMPREF1319_0219 [Capnocytophaga ochracea str. Holt 25]
MKTFLFAEIKYDFNNILSNKYIRHIKNIYNVKLNITKLLYIKSEEMFSIYGYLPRAGK